MMLSVSLNRHQTRAPAFGVTSLDGEVNNSLRRFEPVCVGLSSGRATFDLDIVTDNVTVGERIKLLVDIDGVDLLE
jgi:hypothetical protein